MYFRHHIHVLQIITRQITVFSFSVADLPAHVDVSMLATNKQTKLFLCLLKVSLVPFKTLLKL